MQAYATEVKEHFRDRHHSQAALRSPPHITLQPPFEWPQSQEPDLVNTLADFCPSPGPIPIHLRGFGAFPPRVIYLAVEPTPDLMTLQAELGQFLAEKLEIVDPKAQRRPFHPHLTVAFRDLKPAAFRRAWPEFEQKSVQFTFMVPGITLLQHTGKRWEVHTTFPLT